MSETTVKLASAKLNDAKGISERDASELYTVEGKTRLAIIELQSIRFTNDLDDNLTVTVQLNHLELAPDGAVTDLLRDLSQAIYKARQPAPLDPEINAETVDDIVRRGQNTLLEDGVLVST